MRVRVLVALCLLVPLWMLAFNPTFVATSQPAPLPPACAASTGRCVRGLFYAFWVEGGAAERLGSPVSEEFDEMGADGQMRRVQYFERTRLEYHQEAINTPGVVQMGLLGVNRLISRYPEGAGASTGEGSCMPETGYCLTATFRSYWAFNGNLSRLGLPISNEFEEMRADGKIHRVQYFERARLEVPLDRAGDSKAITQGRLGAEQYAARYATKEPPAATGFPINVWANTRTGQAIDPRFASLPPRVYVPDELAGTVTVIDPATFKVIDSYYSGRTAHHVGVGVDFTKLYVNNMDSSTLLEIDATTGKAARSIPAAVPYNLYFSADQTKAIVAAEPHDSLDFYDPKTWNLIKRVRIPCRGVDHADMSADGRYLLVSCEFDGQVYKVSVERMEVIGPIIVGGLPVDVKVSPDGAVFYIANQGRGGVSVVDPVAMREIEFIPTGRGAHGFAVSRDAKLLYVSNRLNGTISVIDFATRKNVQTWEFGDASVDMLTLNPEGTQLWVSGRYHGKVYVIDPKNGALLQTIVTGGPAPHGLVYLPQPGKVTIGHNGVFR